jgi:hypothetical protein
MRSRVYPKRTESWHFSLFDVCGFVHHSTIHKEKSNKMQKCIKNFYYSIFIWRSTCFGRHTAHHQEPKTALTASGFSCVEGCWTCSWRKLSVTVCLTTSTIYTSNNLSRIIKIFDTFLYLVGFFFMNISLYLCNGILIRLPAHHTNTVLDSHIQLFFSTLHPVSRDSLI